VGVWRLDDLAEELESSCVGVHGPRVSLCLTQLTSLCDRSPVLIRHGHIIHGYVHDIVKSGLEHGPWHGASQKKNTYHGETLRNVPVMRPRDLAASGPEPVRCVHSFFCLSTLAMLTSLFPFCYST
jgi:hypothetical protein